MAEERIGRHRPLRPRHHRAHRRVAGRNRRRRRFLRPHRRRRQLVRRPLQLRDQRPDAGGAFLDADALRSGGPARRQRHRPARLHQRGDRARRRRPLSPSMSRRARGRAIGCRPAASNGSSWCGASTIRRSASRPRTTKEGPMPAIVREGLPMIRAAACGFSARLLLGGIVHLSTVLAMPRAAKQDAYSRLAPIAPVNTWCRLPRRPRKTQSCRSWIRPSRSRCAATIFPAAAQAQRAGQPSLYVGYVLHAQQRRLLRDQRPRRRTPRDRARSDDHGSSTRDCPRKRTSPRPTG